MFKLEARGLVSIALISVIGFAQQGSAVIQASIAAGTNLSAGVVIAQGATRAVTMSTLGSLDGLTPEMCGAYGDGSHDDTTAVLTCASNAFANNRPLLLLNYYRMTSQFKIDLTSYRNVGLRVIGNGRSRSGIKFDPGVPAPNLSITVPSGGAAFYSDFSGFNVQCGTSGVCVQFGNEDFSDQLNEFWIDLTVQNSSTSNSSVALEINGFYNGDIKVVANGSGAGLSSAALKLRQCQFSRIFGSLGNAYASIYLTAGYNVGNVFQAMDLEVATYGILNDSPNTKDNTWIGGTYANLSYGVSSGAGYRNQIQYPSLGLASTSLFAPGKTVGMKAILGAGIAVMGTPPVPPSGVLYQNVSGQPFFINIASGAVTAVLVDGATMALSAPAAVMLQPGQSIALQYSGATPGWTWSPM